MLVDLDYVHDKRVILNKENRPYYTRGNYLYREIMQAQKGEIVDHINRDVLDNRKCNLRIVTVKQNNWNATPNKGVTYDNRNNGRKKRWQSIVQSDGRRFEKRFMTKEEAEADYRKRVVKLRGEYAPIEYR